MSLQQYAATAANAEATDRAAFIRRTYAHLAGAVFLFMALETYLLNSSLGHQIATTLVTTSPFLIFGLYIAASWMANKWAQSETSPSMQYFGLGLYIVAISVVMLPLLIIANQHYSGVIQEAGMMTCLLFGGLTSTVFITKKDFSFLGPILAMCGFIAIGFIIMSFIMGFSLGLLYSAFMVLFMAGCILYDTSRIMRDYRTDQHVGASLSLFASVAILFFYIVRILMFSRD